MYKHLLITLDGSPRAESVVPHAVDIARAMGAEVTLLRVIDDVTADWSERGAVGRSRAETAAQSPGAAHAERYLERVAEQIAREGVTVHALVREGGAARQIVGVAKDIDADAIAMATHSRRGINRLMFGSVAEAVLHESSLPVILVRAA